LAIAMLILTVILVFLTTILIVLTTVMVTIMIQDWISKRMRSAATEHKVDEESRAAADRDYEDLKRQQAELGDTKAAWKAQDADNCKNSTTHGQDDLA
jgi:cell division protein FtsL